MDPRGSRSWLSRTLFLRDETLIGHDDPITVASTLRAPLLRFVYQRLRFMADRLCDSPFERPSSAYEMLQNQVTFRCQQSTVWALDQGGYRSRRRRWCDGGGSEGTMPKHQHQAVERPDRVSPSARLPWRLPHSGAYRTSARATPLPPVSCCRHSGRTRAR